MVAPFIAVQADLRVRKSRRAAPGRNHNEWGFSNRMLDVTIDLMGAK